MENRYPRWGTILYRFGMLLGRFGIDFEVIWDRFGIDFGVDLFVYGCIWLYMVVFR